MKFDKFLQPGFSNLRSLLVVGTMGAVLITGGIHVATAPARVENILHENGYTQVEVEGIYLWCGKGYHNSRYFTATNSGGQKVEGHLCSTFFKDKITTTKIKMEQSANEQGSKLKI